MATISPHFTDGEAEAQKDGVDHPASRWEVGHAPKSMSLSGKGSTPPCSIPRQFYSQILPTNFLATDTGFPQPWMSLCVREVTYARSHGLICQSWNKTHVSWISSLALFPPQPFILLAYFQFQCIVTKRTTFLFVVPTELKEPKPLHQELGYITTWVKNVRTWGKRVPIHIPLLQPSCLSLKLLLLHGAVQTPGSFLLQEDGILWNLGDGENQC